MPWGFWEGISGHWVGPACVKLIAASFLLFGRKSNLLSISKRLITARNMIAPTAPVSKDKTEIEATMNTASPLPSAVIMVMIRPKKIEGTLKQIAPVTAPLQYFALPDCPLTFKNRAPTIRQKSETNGIILKITPLENPLSLGKLSSETAGSPSNMYKADTTHVGVKKKKSVEAIPLETAATINPRIRNTGMPLFDIAITSSVI
jgi:hypothetical protein